MRISMSSPDLTDDEVSAVNQILRTGHLSLGPQLEAFERAMAAYVGTKYAVGVNSGTSGLHLAIIAAGVQEGDLVITTPFSFIASANCILYERAIPVFVDVDRLTGNIDPRLAAEALHDLAQGGATLERWLPRNVSPSECGRLRAILPVDAFGQPADMDPIVQAARQYDVVTIEDSCEAIGAEYKGRQAGTLGDVGVFAFYPNKQMTTGEGGILVTDRADWDGLFRSLRNQGRDIFNAWLEHSRLGYNYRLDEMSAALGLAQLGRLETLLAKREQVARWYTERLADHELVETPSPVPETTRPSWFVYVVRIKPPAERNQVMQKLNAQSIPCRPYFVPIHLQPFYRSRFGYQPGDFPITEELGAVSLALPFSSIMTETEVDQVCGVLVATLEGS